MADTATDQQGATVSSGGQPAEAAAAPFASVSEPAAASSTTPATSDATGKPQESHTNEDTTLASPPAPSGPTTASDSKEPQADAEKDGIIASEAGPGGEATAPTNGTPKSKKDSHKRKSTSEPKGKSLKKKQSMRELHLDVKPGQLWWVRMKGYPNWPAIVCDEDMLPATLLEKRPVSAARTDGSYREDFMDGGKNARDRRYPVMFLGTNEFYWQVNTDLIPLDIQEIKDEVAKGERGKKSVALWNAYGIAAEEHELDHFKGILKSHEEQLVQELQEKAEREAKKAEEKAEREAKKAEEKANKEARKKKVDADGDTTMDGTGSAKKKAASKKRKETSGEAEEEQKGPKKIKIKQKVADEADSESASKPKKEKKSKPKATKDEAPAKAEEPQLTEAQKLEKKEKHILYLRHRLQKGFLSRDHPPKEEEMVDMNAHLKQLEDDPNLEVSVIRNTKINKVLKAILKIPSIPKEEDYNFKTRSTALLSKWNEILGTPAESSAPAEAAKPAVNGDKPADAVPKPDESAAAKSGDAVIAEKPDAPAETTNNGENATKDGDVEMKDVEPVKHKSESRFSMPQEIQKTVEEGPKHAAAAEAAKPAPEAAPSA